MTLHFVPVGELVMVGHAIQDNRNNSISKSYVCVSQNSYVCVLDVIYRLRKDFFFPVIS